MSMGFSWSLASLLAQTVVVMTSTGSFGWMECGYGLGGYFRLETNVLNVCVQDSDHGRVTLHELGHFLFWEKMNGRERAAWWKISNSKTYVSDYAKKSPLEDFSETLAYLNVSKRKFPKKAKFVEYAVMKYWNR